MPAHTPEDQHEPSDPGPEELALIAAGFPSFAIWRSVTADRTRYFAQGLDLSTHPSAVVTDDLEELVTALTADPA